MTMQNFDRKQNLSKLKYALSVFSGKVFSTIRLLIELWLSVIVAVSINRHFESFLYEKQHCEIPKRELSMKNEILDI